MNKVIICGRLTKDPDVRYSIGAEQMCIARYNLAANRPPREGAERQADFIPCVSFGKKAEFAEKYFKQGMKILNSGKITTGSYTNKEGRKVYTTEVTVEEQEFAEAKKEAAESEKKDEGGFMQIPDGVEDEGLPFN